MIAYCDGDAKKTLLSQPALDRDASLRLVQSLFPADSFGPAQEWNLGESYARGSEVHAGCYPSLGIVSADEFAPNLPSALPKRYLREELGRFVYLHAMHSVSGWFAYGIWENGVLIRSLCVTCDDGVIEDLGERREFEKPFWAGARPIEIEVPEGSADDPLPFDPLELGEAALLDLFGFQLMGDDGLDPYNVPLCRFNRRRKWWKFWQAR